MEFNLSFTRMSELGMLDKLAVLNMENMEKNMCRRRLILMCKRRASIILQFQNF